MHITDIFLEELAKVGGEKLDQSVLNIYLQPFLKVGQLFKISLPELLVTIEYLLYFFSS